MPDTNCRPDNVREHLRRYGLHMNEPEPVIICCSCKFSLGDNPNAVTNHLAEKHDVPKSTTKELRRILRPYTFLGPEALRLRPDGSAPHPHLRVQPGVACKHCSIKTTSNEVLSRHLSKNHGVKRKSSTWLQDHVVSGLSLQSWGWHSAAGYWSVKPDRLIAQTLDNSLLQNSIPRLLRLEALHREERDHLVSKYKMSVTDTGSTDMALNTNWMRRTGWAQTFAGADRRLLVQLAQMPHVGQDLFLGSYDSMDLHSCQADERRLAVMVAALGRVFGQCEDTVKHTDVSIRCWLRSQCVDRPYKAPFELVGRESTSNSYQRLMKRCVCFCFRLWRMSQEARHGLLKRSLTERECQAFAQVWEDDIWSAYPLESPHNIGSEEAALNISNRGQDGTEAEDEEGIESDHVSVSTDGSEYWSDGNFEQDLSDFEANASGREPNEASGGPGKTQKCPAVSLGGKLSSVPREAGAITTAVEKTTPGFEEALSDLMLRFAQFLVTEEYEDGNSSSTLLIYFSGVLGMSADGLTFERASNYTSKLSALIYCVRLLAIESTLPRCAHQYINWLARPRYNQLDLLNKVRRAKMCLGSQAPMDELLSLRNYGRAISRTDGPSFRVTWTPGADTVSWAGLDLSMDQFRKISHDTILCTTDMCKLMMYDWQPSFDLQRIQDKLSNTAYGYSFVSDPANGLAEAYLELSRRACLATVNGLMMDHDWDMVSIHRYLDLYNHITRLLVLSIYLVGGQAPRGTELFALEHCNGASTTRGVCVYAGKLALISRHHKARRTTNNEFQVVRFLPEEPGRILYYYLVFIRPFACMLHRICYETDAESTLLFSSLNKPKVPLKTTVLSSILRERTVSTLGFPLNVQTYRQLSIAITEKHVRQIANPFSQYDDKNKEADINSSFAWQSGHRPLQRGLTYGLDGAFPDSLQPALLRVYEWASGEWQKFLKLETLAASRSTDATKHEERSRGIVGQKLQIEVTQKRRAIEIDSAVDPKRLRQSRSQAKMKDTDLEARATAIKQTDFAAVDGPWATLAEIQFYTQAPKLPWRGCSPLFGRPSQLERSSVIQERAEILTHLRREEAKTENQLASYPRLHYIDREFARWRNVGCQLCFATTRKPELDHTLLECRSQSGADKARRILEWMEGLRIPRFLDGLSACSLCFHTNCPCGDVILGIRLDEAECKEEKTYWRRALQCTEAKDGHCENKVVVRRTIAALCAYSDGALGNLLATRLRDENGVDPAAENLVRHWMERRVPFHDGLVLRLLFVFEMLVWVFNVKHVNKTEVRLSYSAS